MKLETSLTKKKKYIPHIFLAVIFLIIGLYLANSHYKKNEMKKAPIYTYGVITGVHTSAKMGPIIAYEFMVNQQLYTNTCLKRKNDDFEIGDSCLVIYSKDDITINDLYRNHLGRLGLVKFEREKALLVDSLLKKY